MIGQLMRSVVMSLEFVDILVLGFGLIWGLAFVLIGISDERF